MLNGCAKSTENESDYQHILLLLLSCVPLRHRNVSGKHTYNRAFDYTKKRVTVWWVLRSPDWLGSGSAFNLDSFLTGLVFSFFWFTARLSIKIVKLPICPLPLTLAQPSSISASPPVGTFMTADQLILMGHNHSKSIV